MEHYLLYLGWIILTLVMATTFGVFGKKYGVEYPMIGMALCVIFANIIAVKIISVGSYAFTAATLVYSITFLFSDMLSEFWGKKYAQRAIWMGFLGLLFYTVTVNLSNLWPSAVFAQDIGKSFNDVFGLAPRVATASLLTYIVVQNIDVSVYHKIKDFSGGKMLWLRNILSTCISQSIDTVMFFTIAFYGIFPIKDLIIVALVVKLVIAILDTPFMYLLRRVLRGVN